MPEYVTEKPTTVCAECGHYVIDPEWLHVERCRAPKAGVWDPVGGRELKILHGKCTGPPFACHLINTGNCPHFEAKEK